MTTIELPLSAGLMTMYGLFFKVEIALRSPGDKLSISVTSSGSRVSILLTKLFKSMFFEENDFVDLHLTSDSLE